MEVPVEVEVDVTSATKNRIGNVDVHVMCIRNATATHNHGRHPKICTSFGMSGT